MSKSVILTDMPLASSGRGNKRANHSSTSTAVVQAGSSKVPGVAGSNAIGRGQIFVTGRLSSVVAVRTVTTRTKPSGPGKTSVIRPSGHLAGVSPSCAQNKSDTAT